MREITKTRLNSLSVPSSSRRIPDSQYGLAQAYSKLGKKEEAKIHLDKFNELSKDVGAEHRKEAKPSGIANLPPTLPPS